jgi:hypothetical protein
LLGFIGAKIASACPEIGKGKGFECALREKELYSVLLVILLFFQTFFQPTFSQIKYCLTIPEHTIPPIPE